MSLNATMSRAECQSFLADVHVGVLSVAETGRGPCTVPVWYSYAAGDAIRVTVPPSSRKVRLLREAGRASMCVQTETLPYRYVSVEGPIEIVEAELSADQREIATRYLGEKLGTRYLAANAEHLKKEVLLLLRPERWWSVDFAKMKI
jgi:nitroimidazol reductase NimA-like FMN-containing flavoprotein (pyridoxamine 5'-phosphate oxidase superfamily)